MLINDVFIVKISNPDNTVPKSEVKLMIIKVFHTIGTETERKFKLFSTSIEIVFVNSWLPSRMNIIVDVILSHLCIVVRSAELKKALCK